MPRDTSTDRIAYDLLLAWQKVLENLTGWGTLASGAKAVYANLGLPQPQEPFTAAYIYIGGVYSDFGQGTGVVRFTYTVTTRILGGPMTPRYKTVPELESAKMLQAVMSELSYRRYLEDPTNNDTPFRYIDPEGKVKLNPVSRIQGFGYSDQGTYIGIEVPGTVMLAIPIGRAS